MPYKKRGKVSIRSPHGCKGRCSLGSSFLREDWMFQSAPLTDVRGDPPSPTPSHSPSRFQSAPLTDVRGDEPFSCRSLGIQIVSIRSPHGCKGRFEECAERRGFCARFNPLPSRM